MIPCEEIKRERDKLHSYSIEQRTKLGITKVQRDKRRSELGKSYYLPYIQRQQ